MPVERSVYVRVHDVTASLTAQTTQTNSTAVSIDDSLDKLHHVTVDGVTVDDCTLVVKATAIAITSLEHGLHI